MNAGKKWPPQAQGPQHKPGQQPGRPPVPNVLQPKSAIPQVKKTPIAPPVYRPQPTPKVLQKKSSPVESPSNGARRVPVAPPVNRPGPVPMVLQSKQAPAAPPEHLRTIKAPPVHSSQSAPQRQQAGHKLPGHAGTAQCKPAPQAQQKSTHSHQHSTTAPQIRQAIPASPLRPVIQRVELGNLVEGSAHKDITKIILSNLTDEKDLISVSRVSRSAYATTEQYRATIDPIHTPTPGEDPGLKEGQSVKEYKEEFETVKEWAKKAYNHMISFVKANGKLGEQEWGKSEADKKAIELLKDLGKQMQNNCSAVVLRKGRLPAVTFNEPPTSKTAVERGTKNVKKNPYYEQMDEVFGEGQYELIIKNDLKYQHAEIRLWEHFADDPSLVYIGIWQSCCLFCSAQLIAAGFKGFGGSHGNIYGHYVFSRKILADPFRRARLFGPEVSQAYQTADERSRQIFLHALATLGDKKSNFKKSDDYQGKIKQNPDNNNNSEQGAKKRQKG